MKMMMMTMMVMVLMVMMIMMMVMMVIRMMVMMVMEKDILENYSKSLQCTRRRERFNWFLTTSDLQNKPKDLWGPNV